MSKPVPVSNYPDEIVTRRYRVRKSLPGLWERERLKVGQLVEVRRSPFVTAPGSFWIEDAEGVLLTVVSETCLRDCLEELKA